MLRKLPGLTVRLFSSSRPALACHDDQPPSQEQIALKEKQARQEKERERLVCDLGALFARFNRDTPEALTK